MDKINRFKAIGTRATGKSHKNNGIPCQDDFYLNLLDWSSNNTIAAGLESVVVLWSGCSSKITHLY